jgi:hypothetical protein
MYLVNIRPYICFAMNTLSRFMVEPRQEHWVATKHVLGYLRGAMEYGLRYLGDGEMKLQGYSNSDWAGNATNRKRSFGFASYLQDYLINSETPQSFTMIIKVLSNSLRIKCFVTGP